MDWQAIEDRTRNLETYSTWPNPQASIASAAEQFKIDKWARQPARIEVWVEKEALIGVVSKFCDEYDIPHFACRGFVSQSELYSAGKRAFEYGRKNQNLHILHLGDHDPSGIDMSRDNNEKMIQFSNGFLYDFKRIALNMDQIEEHNPPPDPAKMTDSRFEGCLLYTSPSPRDS